MSVYEQLRHLHYDLGPRPEPGLFPGLGSHAWLSPDLAYRYRLGRTWQEPGPLDLWVMLNPSTADARDDDATIRRCRGFSVRDRARGLVVVNLFALRSTNPAALLEHEDPVGPDNDVVIAETVRHVREDGGRVIAAWGAHRMATGDRLAAVLELLHAGGPVLALGTTLSGAPRHPLYVPGSNRVTPWPPS